jgi:hypothetical protein
VRGGRSGLGSLLAAAFVAFACGRNPVLGDWELDRDETPRGAVLAVEATDLETLRFEGDAVVSPGTTIPVTYVVEGDVIRVVRGDGRGEHRLELLPDGRLQAELPIGVTAVYRRAGS